MASESDYLVIGSGLAGLTYALDMVSHGSVTVLTKRARTDANSSLAQGGIAGAMGEDDSFELHKQDTLVAGAGLCHEDAVEALVTEGPDRIQDLIRLGANFNYETDSAGHKVLALHREGGHSRNRIVHTADYTGWECERTLLEAVKGRSEIKVLEHLFVTDLEIVQACGGPECAGAFALDEETGVIQSFRARSTLLATGGSGHVYEHTTNPLVATGDGVAMAWRAGVPIGNMEFIQFHPTTLYHPAARAFLITEALRGQGGILRQADGERFMPAYHPLAELAPRDIVARAIVSEMRRKDVDCVYLDATHIDPEILKTHFPTVYQRCLSVGIDLSREWIPIVPAQHYQCGGVMTDLHGATSIPRLYAAGEVACTGVHGANRLASNSLLEAMVFGHRAAGASLEACSKPIEGAPPPQERRLPDGKEDTEACEALRIELQQLMQRYVGIVRETTELEKTQARLIEIERSLNDLHPGMETFEARNMAQVAQLIVASALRRHESRGLHYILDYPELSPDERHDTVMRRATSDR
jgi:L-aspartate oxidase